ncbi:MAG TPA: MlaD family protein [Campylobacterales bacterium]|nr:MlaD family protein [Campylobacterales bacterium]
MESRVNYTLVGVFTIVFLAIFAGLVFWLGKFNFKDDTDKYRVYITESVSGLNIEAPVKYRGIVVGSVADIQIHPQNTEQIEVILKIKKGIPIRATSTASLKPQGITGLSFVDIQPGDSKSSVLKMSPKGELPTIVYEQSLFGKFDSTFTVMTDNLQNILQKANAAMSEKNMAELSKTLQNIQVITAKLSTRLDEIGELTRESQGLPSETKEAIRKLSAALNSANETTKEIGDAVKRGDFDYKKEVAKVSAEVTKVTDEATKLLDGIRELSKESNALVKDIQKNPSSIVFDSKEIPKGPGE